MGKPISVGDTVWVATGMHCCGAPTGAEGLFFVVKSLKPTWRERCQFCGSLWSGTGLRGSSAGAIDMPRCRRIDPPAESSDTQAAEERGVVA